MHDHDAEGRPPRRSQIPIRALRRLMLDAVLLVEEADLRLSEVSVITLRGQLLEAAAKLTLAANGLTNPGILEGDDR